MQWGALGDARAALLGPLRGFLQQSSIKSAVFPNFCYFVRRASVLGAIFVHFLAILAKIRLKSGDFVDRVAGKTENRKSAGYAVPAILS